MATSSFLASFYFICGAIIFFLGVMILRYATRDIVGVATALVLFFAGFGPILGAILRWPDDTAEDRGLTVWHVAEKDSQWFSPGSAPFMINYRVDDLDGMLAQLRAAGVEIVGGPESHENGKFAWILDPDGNKVELWEPKLWDERNKGG